MNQPNQSTSSAWQPKQLHHPWDIPDLFPGDPRGPAPCRFFAASSFAPHGSCCQQHSWGLAAIMLAAAKQEGQTSPPFGSSFYLLPGTHSLLICLNTSAFRGVFVCFVLNLFCSHMALHSNFPFLPTYKLGVLCIFSHILFNTNLNFLLKSDLWVDLWQIILVSLSLLFDQTKLKKKQNSYSNFPTTIKDIFFFTPDRRIDFLAVLVFQTRKCFWLTVKEIRSTWNMCKFRISLICKSVCQYNTDILRS